jgi:hypothetical protein
MLTPEEEKTFVQMVMQVSNREIRSPGDVMREIHACVARHACMICTQPIAKDGAWIEASHGEWWGSHFKCFPSQ